MPRKDPVSELQNEEIPGSPLRRSSRLSITNSPAPAAVTTRRRSSVQEPAAATKGRRLSLQSEANDDEKKVATPTKPPAKPRGRRSKCFFFIKIAKSLQ